MAFSMCIMRLQSTHACCSSCCLQAHVLGLTRGTRSFIVSCLH
jgi:hypothetical protein